MKASQLDELTISLCMMVKDESDVLARCLDSIKDYVDEIVIVDTGSRDNTVEIARSYGARVYHHPWEDDFSKHRNQSISYATGDWFLILDADEEIVEGAGHFIEEAKKRADVDCISFEVKSLYAGKQMSFQNQPRLFRNGRGIKYEGKIHNRITGVTKTCVYPVKILHHGYNLGEDKARRKHERRQRILKRECRNDPENPIHYHYLAVSYMAVPAYEKASRESRKALELADKRGEAGSIFYAWTHYIAVASLWEQAETEEAKAFCRMGLERFPDHLDMLFISCRIAFDCEDGKRLQEHAKRYLENYKELVQKPDREGLYHCVTFSQAWKPSWFLALDHFRQGREHDFGKELSLSLSMTQSKAEVYHNTSQYFMRSGHMGLAKEYLEKARGEDPNDGEILLTYIGWFRTMGDEHSEIRAWQLLLHTCPEKKDKMCNEVTKALEKSCFKEAEKLLRALEAVYPRDPDVLKVYADYARRIGADDKEFEMLDRYLRYRSGSSDELTHAGILLLRREDIDRCERVLNEAVDLHPSNAVAHMGLAVVHWRQKKLELCLKELLQVVELLGLDVENEFGYAKDVGGWLDLCGDRFMENNEPDGALLAYQTALEMDSENGDVCAKAARASRKSGNLEGGIKYLQKAIYLSSNMSPLLKEMGDIYGLLGNKRAARFCYEKSQSVIL